ncbi:hypothetical protein SteCoe_23717 [Stentor coeruleus]|uniref:Uncharacterized protein n=1 Tax=Stentor coeruleus TaxID=5963 RepID=A0A1R2BJ99_9CILI|nr:hypothetical protein SteCoe_23717 [Stentor coeruleus]
MSKFKYEWPYIQFLTRAEQDEYVSDLPKNLDNLKVFHIVPSKLYQNPTHFELPFNYKTREEHMENEEFMGTASLWAVLYVYTAMKSVWSMTRWYNTNIIAGYSFFKAETWGGYFRRRFWMILMFSWTSFHFSYMKSFENYPKFRKVR